jgi:hypothetical protein
MSDPHARRRLQNLAPKCEVSASDPHAREVVSLIRGEVGALEKHGDGPGRGHKRVDNINSFTDPKGGTSSTYLLKRLIRTRAGEKCKVF